MKPDPAAAPAVGSHQHHGAVRPDAEGSALCRSGKRTGRTAVGVGLGLPVFHNDVIAADGKIHLVPVFIGEAEVHFNFVAYRILLQGGGLVPFTG